ncbi:MAG TPA: hypothetical protein VN436_03240, partial [Holophaga sp.]|nr:hypothetical protein [Holophaga sp.]
MAKFCRRQGLVLALALCCALALWACSQPAPKARAADAPAAPAGNAGLSAWIADWDLERGMAEWRAHPGLFDTVRVFAAYFDEKDAARLSPEWTALLGGDARKVFGATPAFL